MESNERCPWCGTAISRTQFLSIEAKIRNQERQKLATARAKMEAELKQKFDADLKTEQLAIEQKIRHAASLEIKAAQGQCNEAKSELKTFQEQHSSLLERAKTEAHGQFQKELEKERAILSRDKELALLKLDGERHREREAFQKKLKLMEHQLQKKTANDLGEAPEIDLYEALRETFPDDLIKRVAKGQNGADVIHDVRYKGQICGRVIVDSKNRQAWQHGFITKLRQDQIDANAEHAILSSTVFPSGKSELCIESGIVVVSPPRVVYIVDILRKAIIAMHLRGLSVKERTSKMSKLYELITSESYANCFGEAGRITQNILDLDVEEKKAHDGIWKKRGTLAKRMTSVLREIETEVAAIVETDEGENGRKPVRPTLFDARGEEAS